MSTWGWGVRSVSPRGCARRWNTADLFGAQLSELLGYFTGTQPVHPGAHALPGERPWPLALAIGSGAAEAAGRGLPVIAPARGEDRMLASIRDYRAMFRPSVWADEPYVVVAPPIAVAGSAAEAERLLLSGAWSTGRARTRGAFPPLWPTPGIPAAEPTQGEREFVEDAGPSCWAPIDV